MEENKEITLQCENWPLLHFNSHFCIFFLKKKKDTSVPPELESLRQLPDRQRPAKADQLRELQGTPIGGGHRRGADGSDEITRGAALQPAPGKSRESSLGNQMRRTS
jgi:hypothetical protein